ncbi:MAG: thioredoxin domain-containing protein [Aggregatilineales bacterium]
MNHLQFETSPYLLQHAANPVDWYAWGEEALRKAKAEDKPILLSIGYSACHWCHVMAHESFEDPDTAAFMNANFVCIKVDREERPDLDDLYMQATLAFTNGHGGWPMTVFLMPDARPFHAGTYFPKDDRYGMPSFQRVMAAVLDAYRGRRDEVNTLAEQVTDSLKRDELANRGADADLSPELLDTAYQKLMRGFDPVHGGLSRGAPKFPNPMNLEYALRVFAHTSLERAREAVTYSLHKMARGGIYDQVGGGFHRYSVDERWLVPHFEKMLYDNAQLSRLYLHAWQATGDSFFKDIAEQIYDYLLREMAAPGGGFYSATDADSEGEEGKFFVWTPGEIRTALPDDQYQAVVSYYGVTETGNFEGRNILNVPADDADVAAKLAITPDELRARIDAARATLYAIRDKRVHPGLDDKLLTAWNGLTLTSVAEAARVLDRDDYRKAAIFHADFLIRELIHDGRVWRTHKNGVSKLNGYLEDYACLSEALLETYQTTFEVRYFEQAQALADQVLAHFASSDGGFYDTADDHESLIARPRSLQDNATPSGNSKFARVLALLAAYTGEARYETAARGILRQLAAGMREYPSAFGEALIAADLLVRGIQEVAIIGDPALPATRALLAVVESRYRPNVIRALSPVDSGSDAVPPLLAQRTLVAGQPAAYVCRHFVCQRPVTDPAALESVLRGD